MKIFTENKFSRFVLKDGEVIDGLIIFHSFDQSYKKHYMVREHNIQSFNRAMRSDRDAARNLCERFEIERIKRSKALEGIFLN
jgi:hypothetical protein